MLAIAPEPIVCITSTDELDEEDELELDDDADGILYGFITDFIFQFHVFTFQIEIQFRST